MSVDIHDVITRATFCDDRLRGLGVARDQISHFPIDLRRRPYNTLVLPCESVMYNYTPQATHDAKFDFDPTTWVVWANSQFATVFGVYLPSFLFFCFLRLAYKSRRRINRHRSTLIRRVLRQGCAFWGLGYLFFTFCQFFTKNRRN